MGRRTDRNRGKSISEIQLRSLKSLFYLQVFKLKSEVRGFSVHIQLHQVRQPFIRRNQAHIPTFTIINIMAAS